MNFKNFLKLLHMAIIINDETRFYSGIAAALTIVLSVIITNGGGQAGSSPMTSALIGMPLFLLGWAGVAYTLTLEKEQTNQVYVWIASVLIVVSAMGSKWYMMKGGMPPMIFPLLFAASWLTLGWLSSNQEGSMNFGRVTGVLGAISVILSMMFFLPVQRGMCIVDGPGMPLFLLGWMLVMFANSSEKIKDQ